MSNTQERPLEDIVLKIIERDTQEYRFKLGSAFGNVDVEERVSQLYFPQVQALLKASKLVSDKNQNQ
jgi:hypothetical protein